MGTDGPAPAGAGEDDAGAAAMRERSAVLFDLDGTLIATKRLYLECYRKGLAPHLGRELTDAELLAARPRSELRLFQEFVPADARDRCIELFYRLYEELHDALFEGVYPGVPELLQALRAGGRRLGIVTGKSRRAWEVTRARVELGPFDVVVVDDDVTAPKPDPAGIRLALEALGADPHEAVYVGDSLGDLHAARAARVLPGAVLWSRAPADRPAFAEKARGAGAVVLPTPGHLLRALGGAPAPAS